ncbi:HNH/ENDO VII family nuclease [Tumebacillus sp. DT12]|uniref:HNH/ENDO VII family nuclease n=1 Tax=Tumebacillus lacus TaxID=2995335 RepID=A0ABT3X3I0_9BACL|nr:HNH/ENDO VII family nuclease [Tumebacillus lacus]MCX7570533.1 HNH/ENDO VII family nuclease [Tumebacillus lacus]
MITADPNTLRYGAHRFAAAAQELQRQSLQLEQTATSVRQGSDGWSGEGSQSFLLRGERLAAYVKKASSAFESVAHTLSRFAIRMEQVLELRRHADRLDQQAFEYGDDSLDSIHTRQHLRHQAAQLRHQADAEASNADSQASTEFQMIAKMIPPNLVPGADAVSPLLEGLPKHWQEYYSRHPDLLEEETGAPTLTADQIEANRRSDAMTILIEYHKQSQSLWLSDEDRTEAARVFCEQSYSKLTADDLENEISRISAEEERNKHWQDQIQNGAHGKELIQQEGYTEYAMKQYYQDGAVLGMAAAITAVGGSFKRSQSSQGYIPENMYWNRVTEFKEVKVYQRNDIIDPNKTDAMGRTNIQRMQQGLAPIGPDGKSVNLHHMTQRNESSIAEVTQTFHQENTKVLHINPHTVPSGINRTEFNKWKSEYWKNRAATLSDGEDHP